VRTVLRQLPLRYQLTIWVVGIIAFAGVGAWLAFTTPVELLWSSGAVLGAALGVLLVAGFIRAIHPDHQPHPGIAHRRS
jgi:hypothetical protein